MTRPPAEYDRLFSVYPPCVREFLGARATLAPGMVAHNATAQSTCQRCGLLLAPGRKSKRCMTCAAKDTIKWKAKKVHRAYNYPEVGWSPNQSKLD